MAWTAAQQAAIERAQGRSSPSTDGLTDEQREAIERARQRAAGSFVDEYGNRYYDTPAQTAQPDGGPGFLGAAGNAVVRMGGRAVGLTDAYQAERLAEAARVQEEMSRREAAGEMSLLDRIATWRPSWAAPLETPDELRGLAADRVTSQAQRDAALAEQFPMSDRGARGVRALSEADTFAEGLGVVARQPLDVLAGALEVGVEQAPTLAAAAAATIATRNPNVGMGIMGASTYAQERFGQMATVAQDFGYDLTDPQQARAAVQDEEFMRAQEARGMTRGAVIAVVDALTFRAGAAFNPATARGFAANTGLQVGGGAGGEALAQLATEGEISAPGEVILEGLAEGPFAAVEGAMARVGRQNNLDGPTPTGTRFDAELAAEEAALAGEARRQQEEQAVAQDVEVRTARLDYAPTFISERDFATQQQEAVRRDATNPETETGQAYRQYLLENDILPTNPQEEAAAVNAFVKQTLGAQDAGSVSQQYRLALDEHIGRMRDLETVLTADPAAEQQLEMDLNDPNAEVAPAAEAAPAAETQDGQLEMDLVAAQDTVPRASDPVSLATELVRATGVAVDDRVAADISARMSQIVALPVEERVAAARALVANYTTPQKKTPARTATTTQAQPPADNTVARVPPEITMETPVRRRQDAQAKADALLPSNWTEDAAFDNVGSALNSTRFNIKKFNTALEAALNPQEAAQAEAAPEANADTAPTNAAGDARRALIAEANRRLGADWASRHSDIMELIGRDRLKSAADRIAEVAPVEASPEAATDATPDTEANLPAVPDSAPTEVAEAAALPSIVENANLSGSEQKVFKALMDAFRNNEEDAVLQADGSWNTAEIGRRAGVGPKTANTYISRSVNKIAKSIGVTPDQMRERLRQSGRERRQGEAAPAFDAPTTVLDVAELGDSVGTRASANQGARDGMSKADQAYLDEKISQEPDLYESKRQELADRERRNDTARLVKRYGQMASQLWQNISSGGAVRLQNLSAPDLREWLGAVEEHAVGEITYDQLVADQREMESRYDADQASRTMEELDGPQTIEGRATAGSAEVDGVPGARAAEGQGGGNETQQVRRADTGAPRGESQRSRDVAQEISDADPTPREMRNQRSFKEEYAQKEGRNSALWENPDLAEASQLADWLGSLSQAQWDAINPSFTNDLNPFKNPASIDFQEAKARLEAAMGQPAADTGVVGGAATAPIVEVRRKRKVVNRPKFSLAEAEANAEGTIASNVKNAVKWLIGQDANWRVATVQNPDDLIIMVLNKELNIDGSVLGEILAKSDAQGVVVTDNDGVTRAFFFTDNIRPGAERGVVMHEVGSHLGMDNVLTSEQKATAVRKIREWATTDGKSMENLIALKAQERLSAAQRADAAADVDSELLAYFLEEAVNAGVTPNSDSKSELVKFIRQLWADFKSALRRLRPENEPALTAQDLVNMARGAARLELATDFHGATGPFRKANSDYFGLGANAVGVGFYVSEDLETGAKYMIDRMKERDAKGGVLQRIDTTVAENEYLNWDAPMREQPSMIEAFNNLPEEIQDTLLDDFGAETVDSLTGRQFYIGLTQQQLRDYNIEEYIPEAAYDRAQKLTRQTSTAMSIVSAFLDANGIRGIKTEIKTDSGNPAAEFNKVIFNDKNVIVVGRNDAGDVDAQFTTSGTVRFSVPSRDPVGGPQVDWVARNVGDGAAQHASNLIEVAKSPVRATKNLRRVVRDVEKDMPSARKWYDSMLEYEKTRNEVLGMVESVVNQARTAKMERKALINDFLASSTFYQKWGYDPQWTDAKGNKVAVTIDPTMKRKYDRLNAEEQQLVRDVFEHGRTIQEMMQQVAKDLGVSQFFRLDSKLTGPYAPLKRFGDFVGQLKSQTLLDAEAQLATDKTATARQRVEKLKSDPQHYVISFFASKGEAESFIRANRDAFAYAEASEKAVDFDEARPGGAKVYEKILGAVNANAANLDQGSKEAVAKLVRDMYFQTLEDSNARLSGLRRLNRAGFDKDMLRSFAAHGSAQANLIAQLKHGAEISAALIEAKREAGKSTSRLMPVYNQLATKFRAVSTPRTGVLARVEDSIMNFNSFYMLTSSMGYFFQNQTQPIYAAAQIAGEFGYTKQPAVFGKLLSGYGVARKVVNTGWMRQAVNVASMGALGRNSAVELDITKAPPELRPVLQALQDRGILDVGVAEDLSRFSIDSEGGLLSRGYREMTHRLYQSARYVESMNRISSAVAAFKMAQQNPAKMRKLGMSPLEYAVSVVEDTQGNFSQLDAPALFDAMPIKAPLQFRKFQFQMAWLHIDALKQAFRGADAETKLAGFRKASLLMGYTGVLGGLTAVPMAGVASAMLQAVLGALDGEDEENPPRSLERWIRENVDDEGMATLLARGVPAALGWDFSQKVDQSDIFMPYSSKYVDLNPDRDGYLLFAAQLALGPTGTTLGNIGNIHDFLNRGDLYRAAEYALPKGLRSYMETMRFAGRGMETRAGIELRDPTDFDMFDFLSNAMGLPSTEINQIRWTRGQQIEMEKWFTSRSGSIRRDYLEAYDARDRAGMAEARDAFRELNAARDRVRPFFNNSSQVLRRQPLSNLLSAPRDRMREQRRMDSAMGR